MVQLVENAEEKKKDVEGSHDENKEVNQGPLFGVRHVQMLLLFMLVVLGYSMRVNLSVGIVAMTDSEVNPDFPTYNWTDNSVVLSSFFWGYVIPQIGAGQIAKNFGPRWALLATMSINSLFTVLIPFMAELGSYGVMICRVMQGLSQGFFFPSIHNLVSKWVPTGERTRLATFVYAGGPFGTVLALPITGLICGSSWGWPSVFYIFGAMGFVWVLCYLLLGANSVQEHKSISPEEKEYILSSLGHQEDHASIPTPWWKIATSLPVWCILIAHCGQNWGFWTLLTEIPTYINKVIGMDIKSNGLISAVPYFVLFILSFGFSYCSDLVINKRIVSIGVARKITTFIGLAGPAVPLLVLAILGKTDSTTAIALLIVAVGINSASYAGYQLNHIDLSPNHAGTLMGITNGMANLFSIIAPLTVQFIVTDESDASQWSVVFYIASGIYIVVTLFYCFFGSGEVQSWDSYNPKKDVEEVTKSAVTAKEAEAKRS